MNNDQKPTITLAQWCAYLPYDIDIFLDTSGCLRGKCKVNINNLYLLFVAAPLYKPLLRRLDFNVEKLIDEAYNSKINWRMGISYDYHSNCFYNEDVIINIEHLPNSIIQALLAAHYDIFNLIPQGLALPIE